MQIHEVEANEAVIETLIALSKDWEAEQSCHGYRANTRADIEGDRIFLAEEGGAVVGYLFGKMETSKQQSSIMPDGTRYFEIEELYVIPAQRSRGVGAAIFAHVEEALRSETDFLLLSTATKNARAILHFYLDAVGMQFWSARLFKRIN